MVLSQLRSLPTVTLAPFKLEFNNSIPRFTFCHFLTWQYLGSLRTWKTVKSFKVVSDARAPWRNEFHGWVHPVTRLIAKLIYEWNWNPRPGRNIIWGYLDWLPISSFYVDSYLYPMDDRSPIQMRVPVVIFLRMGRVTGSTSACSYLWMDLCIHGKSPHIHGSHNSLVSVQHFRLPKAIQISNVEATWNQHAFAILRRRSIKPFLSLSTSLVSSQSAPRYWMKITRIVFFLKSVGPNLLRVRMPEKPLHFQEYEGGDMDRRSTRCL